MAEIIKAYKESQGAKKFVGKQYFNSDRGAECGTFGPKWFEWFENNWFSLFESEKEVESIGLMRENEQGAFEYWIGVFMPSDFDVPDGFQSIDFPERELGVCWVYGKENEVFFHEEKCSDKLKEEGFNINPDWCFERYTCRYSSPDDKGNVILDVCFFLN